MDEDHHSAVCVIGPDVVAKLFAGIDPIGREIRAGQGRYEIVGVAAPKGSVLGHTQDNFVMIPLGTYRSEWLAPQDSVQIFVEARSRQAMSSAADEARVILRARHHERYEDEDNFGIVEPSALMGIWDELTANIFGVAVWVTSVFLLVGGIVIMNIMLASVTERTREIGVRMAIGATESDVQRQFLSEAMVLSLLGGMVGILLGIFGSIAVSDLFQWATLVSPLSIVVAAAFSAAVGVFFGYYPARRAAQLDPIEALRYE